MPYDFNKLSDPGSATANSPKAGGNATTHMTTSADGTTEITTTRMMPGGTAMRVVVEKSPGRPKTTTTVITTPDGNTSTEITRSGVDVAKPAHHVQFQDIDDYDNDKDYEKNATRCSRLLTQFKKQKLKEKQQQKHKRLDVKKERAHTKQIVHDDWREWREEGGRAIR